MNEKIIFKAELNFKGPLSNFLNTLAHIHDLGIDGLKIDTVPLPESPFNGLKIGSWPTPESPSKGLMVGSWPTPESPSKGLMISTWPLPEKGAKGIMIDTVPLPEKKFNGLLIGTWPILEKNGRFGVMPMPENGLSKELENDLIEGIESFKVTTDIRGGIRNAHLHVKDRIYLIDKDRFKAHVGQIALEIIRDLTEKTIERPISP